MAFPDWYGPNWEAFNDCFAGFLHERSGEIVAIVIDEIDRVDPGAAFEFGVAAFGVDARFQEATPFHVFAVVW